MFIKILLKELGIYLQETEWRRLIHQGKDFGDYYLISNDGEIKNIKNGKTRKQYIGKNGYYLCGISCGSRKNKYTIKVHKALAETFIPNINKLPMVNHIDGDKLNNSLHNLEWCTSQENINHAMKYGLRKSANISAEECLYIKENYIFGHREFGIRALSRKFNVNYKVILRILRL